MEQKNKQKVFFKDTAGNWWENQIDLKDVYTRVHGAGTKYGSSADMLLSEMMANVLELVREGRISLKTGLIITDYGCGRSKAANVVGKVLANNGEEISHMCAEGKRLSEVLDAVMPLLKAENALNVESISQVELYGSITVQRYDIGIPAFSKPLERRADVTFCNDVFEHIPEVDLPAFIEDLEATGEYIFASISLRDAVNYSPLEEALVMCGAKKVCKVPKDAIVLEKDKSGAYIFSLHVSVFKKAKWQKILGSKWNLLSAQDYTACSAMNFKPSDEYASYKRELIAKVGFADFIAFPTPVGTRYESDPILFRRVAMMQPAKHIMKLNALQEYSDDSLFKSRETAQSIIFLEYLGFSPKMSNGVYHLGRSKKGWLRKLYKLERLAKKTLKGGENPQEADRIVAQNAEQIMFHS